MARKPTYEELEQRVKELEAEAVRYRQAERNLQESEARFRAFMDNNPAVAYIKNLSGQHIYGNKTLFDKFDISPDKFLGTTSRDIFPPAEAEKIQAYDEVVKTKGVSVETDDWLDKWQGQMRWWKEIKFPIKPPAGDMLIGGIAFDITERKQREEKMRMMQFAVDHAMDRIAWIAPDGRFLYANKAACKEMGYTLDEVLSMRVSDIDPTFRVESWAEHYQEVKKRGSTRLETQQVAGDGKIHDMEVFTNVVKFGDREFMCSFGRDITELRLTERALREQLEFELLIADIAARLGQTGPEGQEEAIDATLRSLGQFLHTDRSFLAQFSGDGKSLKHTNIWAAEGVNVPSSLFELDIAADLPWLAQRIRNGGVINAGPGLIGLPDAANELRHWLDHNGINSGVVVPVSVEGRSIGFLGLDTLVQPREYPQAIVDRLRILADVIGSTLHRIRAQKNLQQYRHIVESSSSAIGLVDRNYVYQYVNEPYCSAFSRNRQEIIGNKVVDLLGQDLFDSTLKEHYDRCFAGEEVVFQSWFDLPGWGNRFMDVRYSPFFSFPREVSAVVVSAHDITEVKQVETKLKESEERFRAFMDNNPAAIYIKDETGRHIYGNRAILELTGMELKEFVETNSRDLFPRDLADRLEVADQHVIDKNKKVEIDEFFATIGGKPTWRRDIKFPIHLQPHKTLLGGIAIDITDRKRVEQELERALSDIELLNERLEAENIYLREEIKLEHQHESFIGKSHAVKYVLHLAEEVAKTDSTVLILGETGTGKELLAREIHNLSARKNRPIVNVNCVSLPPSLVEAELFGREKGAYTGALTRQAGRFEIADGATIFLDEIGELPLGLQVKLLRILDQGQFERLGSSKTLTVDVRVIAATNRDLEKEIAEGKFREDLYFRLNVYSIKIPPLRDRLEDIPPLVWAFVREFGDRMGKKIDRIPRNAIEALKRYDWPGNVRELRNAVERAMIVSRGSTLEIDKPRRKPVKSSQIESLDELQRNHIVRALETTGWRVSGKNGAAEILKINPKTLQSRMRKLGINRA